MSPSNSNQILSLLGNHFKPRLILSFPIFFCLSPQCHPRCCCHTASRSQRSSAQGVPQQGQAAGASQRPQCGSPGGRLSARRAHLHCAGLLQLSWRLESVSAGARGRDKWTDGQQESQVGGGGATPQFPLALALMCCLSPSPPFSFPLFFGYPVFACVFIALPVPTPFADATLPVSCSMTKQRTTKPTTDNMRKRM